MKTLRLALYMAVWVLFLALVTMLILWGVRMGISVAHADPPPAKDRFVFPELRAICAAESMGDWNAEPRHWDRKGDVLRGRVDPDDVGQCQINMRVWGAKARELGYDLLSYNGNVAMANWIYSKYGTGPWEASRPMWDK